MHNEYALIAVDIVVPLILAILFNIALTAWHRERIRRIVAEADRQIWQDRFDDSVAINGTLREMTR